MGNFLNMENPFFQFMNKVGNMILVTGLWLLGCIPIITIGTSTAAMYYATSKSVRREVGYVSREFWKAYKMNLKNGIILTLGLLAIAAFLILDRLYVHNADTTVGGLMIMVYNFMILLCMSVTLYLFPNLSRFTMGKKDLIKLSFFMVFRHLPTTLALLAICILGIIGVYLIPVLIILIPGLVCYVDSFLIDRVMLKYMPKPEEGSEEAEKWYYQ